MGILYIFISIYTNNTDKAYIQSNPLPLNYQLKTQKPTFNTRMSMDEFPLNQFLIQYNESLLWKSHPQIHKMSEVMISRQNSTIAKDKHNLISSNIKNFNNVSSNNTLLNTTQIKIWSGMANYERKQTNRRKQHQEKGKERERELFGSWVHDSCIWYSWSRVSGSDPVAWSRAGSFIHSWYLGTCASM